MPRQERTPSWFGSFVLCPFLSVSFLVIKFLFFWWLFVDVTKVLTELEFTIQRVKVTTTPDGRVLDMFFITDAMDLLHTKQRQTKTCDHLTAVLGEHGVSCEIELAGPELESLQRFSSLPPEAADELFGSDVSSVSSKVVLTVDNHLSPAHTLLHINCLDQKGLFYDILRTSKDCDVHVTFSRLCLEF